MYYVYFAQSIKTNKIYVGYTHKLPNERIEEHNRGASTWTKIHRPLKLIYYEKYYCKKDAKEKELFYKSGFGKRIKHAIVNEVVK